MSVLKAESSVNVMLYCKQPPPSPNVASECAANIHRWSHGIEGPGFANQQEVLTDTGLTLAEMRCVRVCVRVCVCVRACVCVLHACVSSGGMMMAGWYPLLRRAWTSTCIQQTHDTHIHK
jgi:hypothetical protein